MVLPGWSRVGQSLLIQSTFFLQEKKAKQSLPTRISHLLVIAILPLVISHIQVLRLSQKKREEKGDAELNAPSSCHPPTPPAPIPAATAGFPALPAAHPPPHTLLRAKLALKTS